MRIQDIMHTFTACCRTTDSLNQAAHLMWEHDCGALPVIGADGRLVGMITDRDVCMAASTEGKVLTALRVADAMTSEVVTCNQSQDVNQVVKAMALGRVRRAPVVDNDRRVIGMVTIGDVARATTQAHARLQGLSCESVVATMAAICSPRREGVPAHPAHADNARA